VSEKELPPTAQRLRQARERGQLGVSQDLIKTLKFAIISEAAFATEPMWRALLGEVLTGAVLGMSKPLRVHFDGVWIAFFQVVLILAVLACTAAVISLLGVLAQTRFNVAPRAFESGIEKLNPAANLKQLVSGQKLLMLVMGPVKILALLVVCYLEIEEQLPAFVQLHRLSPDQGWQLSVEVLHGIGRRCLGVLVVLVVVDVALQRYMTYRSLRMDIQETRRDYKESEGDPELKGKRKSIAKQNAMEAPKERAPGASAVVVNPQHIAVALAFDFKPGTLPRIVDKGRDEDAFLLRRIAAQRGIPVIKYVGLARQLYATGREGAPVPRHTLRAVALLYRAVQELGAGGAARDVAQEVHEIDEELGQAMLALQGRRPSTPAA